MKQIKLVPIKPIRLRFNLDSDRDEVNDWKDCMPFNKKYQHISKRLKDEINKLPISVESEESNLTPRERYDRLYPIGSKEAKQKAPKAVQQFYSAVKRHPGLIREINESEEKWQKKFGRPAFIGEQRPRDYPYLVVGTAENELGRLGSSTGGQISLFGISKEDVKGLQNETPFPVKQQDVWGHVLYHELTHEEQYRRDPKLEQKYVAYRRKHEGPYRIIKNPTPQEINNMNKLYYSNPYEVEANKKTSEKLNKRLMYPTEEEIYEGYRKTMELD